MQLKELLDQLAYGELSQISIGKQDAGVINDLNVERVVSNINLALTAIHKRFALREGRLTVHLNEGTMIYELDKGKLSRSDQARDRKYLEEEKLFKFGENLLKVERVYNDTGTELNLNDLSDPFSLRTPRYDLLEVPGAMVKNRTSLPRHLQTKTLDVRYRANHPRLGKWKEQTFIDACGCTCEELNDVEVDLPYHFVEPLVFWVASRFHNPVGMSNEFHAGNSYYAKYEAACQRLEQEGLQVDLQAQPGFRREGWA